MDDTQKQKVRHMNVLTKLVHPEWYRRYAKILDYEERIFIQPLRELKEEKALLQSMITPPEGLGSITINRSNQLAEVRGKKVQLVLQILEGNVHVDVKSLKFTSTHSALAIHPDKQEKKQTLFFRARAVRPPGYVLRPDSKWRLFWESPKIMNRMKDLIKLEWSLKIKHKWIKAFRTIQGVNTFTAVLADIAGSTEVALKKFNIGKVPTTTGFFDRKYFRSARVGIHLDQEIIFTLSKDHPLRTKEEAQKAATALRVIQAFAEFPIELQRKICEVAWYLEVDEDKYIIREGHIAESFYFFFSGKVVGSKTSTETQEVVDFKTYTIGALIGEEGIKTPGYRDTSVRVVEKSKVIMIDIEDYNRVCMMGETEGVPPDHIVFLSQLTFMKYFPIEELIYSNPQNIQLFYFSNGAVISEDVFHSQFIFVIYKGSCKVLVQLKEKIRKTKNIHLPPIDAHKDCTTKSSYLNNGPNHRSCLGGQTASVGTQPNRGSKPPQIIQPELLPRPSLRKPVYSKDELQLHRNLGDISEDSVSADKHSVRGSNESVPKSSRFSRGSAVSSEESVGTKSQKKCVIFTRDQRLDENDKPLARLSASQLKLSNAASQEFVILSRKSLKEMHDNIKPYWVQLKNLAEGDHVGIETLDLGDGVDLKPPKIAVVSEGATVILVNKKYFMENANDYVRMDLRANGPRFPCEVMLKKELDRKTAWNKFHTKVLTDNLINNVDKLTKCKKRWKYPEGMFSESIVEPKNI